ncbi:MAG: autotransporter domain-containing protein, partial [Alphaproteobacteria bacterium]
GNVVINVTGNSVIGYTAADSDTPTSALTDGGWIIAGANRTGATVASTEVNLNTSGTIRIAGDVHAGSRQRASAPDTDENSVIGNATLNMLGGGNINIGGDVRAYHVGGATELNINNVDVNVVGTVKEFQTINMDENAKLTAGALVLTADDTLNMTLASADAYSQIDVDTLDANGATLNMTVRGAGTYNVVSANTVTSDFTWNKENAVYTLTEENGTVTAVLKSSSDIAEENGITKETAAAIAGVAQSTSEKLNDLAVKMQEKLAEDTAEAKQEVEKAAAAVHPEKESVAQSIAASVQTTVANLTGARMRMVAPRIGRNGGDARLTGGGVWAQGLFNKSKQNDAFSGYTRGIAAGMDGTINKVWTIGAGYSYAHSDISGTGRDTEIDSNTIFVYGQYKPTQWYVNAVLNYTMSDFSEEGVVMGTPVTGDYNVNSFGGVIATGYDFASGVTPELGLRYMHVMADDYTNSMDVKTKSKDTDFLTGIFGAKYAFGINMDRYTKLIPQLNAAVKYDMLSDRNISTVTMPGVDSYTLRGERLSRLGGEFGIGLGLKYKTLDFSINYDIDVRKDYTSQTGMLKFRYNF